MTGAFRFGDDQMTLMIRATQMRDRAMTTMHFCNIAIWKTISLNAAHSFLRCFWAHAQQAIY
ncbi:MAG: hypothetical protein RLZ59_561 [Pseudomonadota bacterium]